MRSDEIVIHPDPLRTFTRQLFQQVGVPSDDATATARVLVETDLRGIHSHGTRAAPRYVQSILEGKMKAQPSMRIENETPAIAVIDADRGLGHVAALYAMSLAIEKAGKVGTGTIAVKRSHHLGAASIYAMMALEHEMIGFATTSTGGPSVAPYGGRGAALANHPLAWAFPTQAEFPIIVDMAVGVSSWGKVETAKIYGEKLTPGWCMDKDGNPTLDPAAAWTMFPAGGTRGYSLSLVAGIMGGLLAGGQFPSRRDRLDPAFDSEHLLTAVSIEHFGPLERYFEEIGEAMAACQGVETLEGFDRVYLPGELEWEKQHRWQEQGMPLHREHLRRLAEIAKRVGVDIFW